MTLVQRDDARVWHPYTQMLTRPAPIPIVRGAGAYLFTEAGRRLFDGTSSWWVNIHGHAHPALNAALAAQAQELEHVVFAQCTHRPAVELAERLTEVVPKGLTRVFYSDNGSTAVEVAMKMACQYWGNRGETRRTFVTLHHAYHGDTVGAMSASEDSIFTRPFGTMLFNVVRADAPYCYRCPLGLERARCEIDCLGSLSHALSEHAGDVAAVLVEPMLQGAGGMIVWPAEFLAGVRRLCDQHGVLMIADEVLTGFGRTGRMFACEHASISPDLICLSKAITGGYMPFGVTVATDAIYDAFLSQDRTRTFFHGHSFTANPLACALSLASLKLFAETPLIARIGEIERGLKRGLSPLAASPVVGDVRVIGGVGIVELVADKASKQAAGYLDALGPAMTEAFLARDILLRPLGNVLYVMPPYVTTDEEISWLTAAVRDVIREVVER